MDPVDPKPPSPEEETKRLLRRLLLAVEQFEQEAQQIKNSMSDIRAQVSSLPSQEAIKKLEPLLGYAGRVISRLPANQLACKNLAEQITPTEQEDSEKKEAYLIRLKSAGIAVLEDLSEIVEATKALEAAKQSS